MPRLLCKLALLLSMVLTFVGCLESTQKMTLNPDRTGKVEFEIAQPDMNMMMNQDKNAPQPSPEEKAKTAAKGFINRCKGVEAISDFSFRVDADGRHRFMGIAYFSKVEDLDLGGMKGNITWAPAEGGMELRLNMNSKPSIALQAAALTDEQIAQKVSQAKSQWKSQKPGMAMAFSSLKINAAYILPGTIDQSSNFQKVPGGVQVSLDGAKFIEVMDKLMSDDELLAASIKAGRQPNQGPDDDTISQLLFGEKAPIRAHVSGEIKPLFDYKTESETAKAAQPGMLKKLGLE